MKWPLFRKQGKKDYFFGLFLKETKGICYILEGQDNHVSILAKEPVVYSDGWENLVKDVDEVLFKLENATKTRIDKTILFLFSHFLDPATGEIKRPYLEKVREMTKSLEIKPIGFIESQIAVSQYLEEKNGMPLTAILVEIDKTNIGVFVYKSGSLRFSAVEARTDNIIDDLEKIFADSVGKEVMPTRIILYNSSHLVEESSKIISHRWNEDLFVQTPRVEIMREEEVAQSLVGLFEDQMYRSPAAAVVEETVKETPPKEVMGFLIGGDIRQEKPTQQVEMEKKHIVHNPTQRKFSLESIFSSLHDLFSGFHMPSFGNGSVKILPIGISIAIIAIILLIGTAFEYFFHRATILVTLPSVLLEKQFNLKGSSASEEGLLLINVSTSSATATETKATNGKRDIGDKARGEVTVYNFDDKERSIAKGTVLKIESHTYTSDDTITVAASSIATDGSAKLPGKSKVHITATDIGTESNIEKNQRFNVGDISSSVVFAMNDNAITGGTRKTVRTVAQKDIDDLKAAILAKSKTQEQAKFKNTLTGEVAAIDSLMSVRLSDVKQTREVGEEGDTVTVKATVLAQYYFYSIESMKRLLSEQLKSDVPVGYSLPPSSITYELKNAKQEKGFISLPVFTTARAAKRIDLYMLRKELVGKSTDKAKDLALSQFGATSVEIAVTPSLAVIKDRLPFFIKNITAVNNTK